MSEETTTTPETWMEEARGMVAQCWCTKENEHKTMDTDLAEAMARQLAAWMADCAHGHRAIQYYQGLLDQIGGLIGEKAYICDDGGKSEDVLRAKLPELVAELAGVLGAQPSAAGPAPAPGSHLGEGEPRFEVVVRLNDKTIHRKKIHDPFVRTTTTIKGVGAALKCLTNRGLFVETMVNGTNGAMREVMMLDPAKML